MIPTMIYGRAINNATLTFSGQPPVFGSVTAISDDLTSTFF